MHNNRLYVVGFFRGPDFFFALCNFPSNGGACNQWLPLSESLNRILFTAPLGENDIKVAFSGSRDDHKEFGTLIRASDGQVLWSGPLLVNGVFPILKEVDGNTYEVSEPDKWLDVSRTVAMGGDINIFSRVTRLEATDMDESTVQRLVKAKAQLVPSLTRLEVLRVHARELANAARRSFERP